MARALRITFPGAFYHVTSRGNERKAVFKSKRDREKFLEYLESATRRYDARIHAYRQEIKGNRLAVRHWGIWSITVLQACSTKDRKR
jgi:hypothetical protein